jgi:hypothetical protein
MKKLICMKNYYNSFKNNINFLVYNTEVIIAYQNIDKLLNVIIL